MSICVNTLENKTYDIQALSTTFKTNRAFINKGNCIALRQINYKIRYLETIASIINFRKVDVPFMNSKTKKKEKRMKQVVIGNLKEFETFGEYSCTMKEPM